MPKGIIKFTITLGILAIGLILVAPKSSSATTINTPTVNSTLSNGLVGWWTMDGANTNATQALDKSGNGNYCTRSATLKLVTGKVGQAGKFSNSSCVTDSFVLGSPINDFTVTMWLKWDGDDPYTMLIGGQSPGYANIQLYDSKIGIGPYGVASLGMGATNIPANRWAFITVTYNTSTKFATAYLNGIYDGQRDMTSWSLNGGFNNIGGYASNFTNGSIDDVRVYSRVLSITEIQQLYKQGGGKINKTDLITAQLRSGLVGHWTMDGQDTNATQVLDKSGNNNTGTLTGGVTKVSGKIGQAMKFDGTSGKIDISAISGLESTQTKSIWFYGTNFSGSMNQYLIDEGANNNWIQIYQQKIRAGSGVVNFLDGNVILQPNRWNHVAVVTYSGNILIYINGILDNSGNGNNMLSPLGITLGDYAGSGYKFVGKLDDVRIYNRALSATEVIELYKQGGGKINKTDLITAQLRSGLVGHWTMDGKDVDASSAFDKSGLGNTGTRTGGTKLVSGKIGQAMKFDGSSGYVDVGDKDELSFTNNIFTFSFWMKANDTTSHIGVLRKIGDWEYSIRASTGGTLIFNTWTIDGYNIYATSVAYNTTWTHFVWSADGSKARLYKNGILVSTVDRQGTETNSGGAFRIGSGGDGGGNYYMNGSLDDVRVYNRALSATEIQMLYRMGK